ncbi:MAG: hypothetical protein ACR2QC_00990 [Gammaproteobacteria bacterium]
MLFFNHISAFRRQNSQFRPPPKFGRKRKTQNTKLHINPQKFHSRPKFRFHLKFHPCTTPSHSCEGRNLRRRKAAGNCTITAFGVEIPAFAGMGRG